ncbi:MAG: hypothetical protein ACOVK2_02000 [Candidatus Fonsibacter sp.]
MEITVEFRELKLRCEIEFTAPTFEEEYLNLNGNFEVDSIKLEDSEIDILDLLFDKIDYIKLLISDQL